jgi:hypothetical protein
MQRLLSDGGMLLAVLAMLAGCASRKPLGELPDGLGVLHLHTTNTRSWCSGVPPPDQDHATPKPWSTVWYVRPVDMVDDRDRATNDPKKPVLDSLHTAADGHGHLRLPPGTYILVDRDRVDIARYQHLLREHAEPTQHRKAINKKCLDTWLHGPFPTVTITAGDTTHVERVTQVPCSWQNVPCAPWDGPLPP